MGKMSIGDGFHTSHLAWVVGEFLGSGYLIRLMLRAVVVGRLRMGFDGEGPPYQTDQKVHYNVEHAVVETVRTAKLKLAERRAGR